ncbi:MAG: substrate-binding domain-containing protein [Defluviitaleaceae bacterium]|nr:substrate-binding domain-containing protein [Defluviitaleaceae bacterium]
MKYLCLLMLGMLLLSSCGRNGGDSDDSAPTPEPYVSASPTETSQDAAPSFAPNVDVPRGYRHHVLEDGIRQFSMSFVAPENLISSWWRQEDFRRGHQGGPILVFEGSADDYFFRRYLFELSEGTGHLESWVRTSEYEFWTGLLPRNSWVQPDSPSDIFVTENGIIVVRYEHTSSEWIGWDITPEEHLTWDWDTMPPRRYDEYITAVYFFRQDGRDVRDFGAQIFYYAVTFAPADIFAERDAQVRGILESIRFGDVPEISLTPSEMADALGIDGSNFPRINGSTSTIPLVQNIFMTMYASGRGLDDMHISMWDWSPYWIAGAARTIPSYELLIGNYVDLILVPEPSAAALAIAEESGIELEFTPVAVEALVFLTSMENPVTDITREQLLAIYSDRSITNWEELGGLDGAIIPLNRNLHSGSQTLMDNLVLRQEEMHESLAPYQIGGMEDMLGAINHAWVLYDMPENTFTIGYTVYYFLQQQPVVPPLDSIRVMSFEGITPTSETIASGEYTLTTHYYAVIRADSPADSPERLIRDWLISDDGQDAVERATLGRIR